MSNATTAPDPAKNPPSASIDVPEASMDEIRRIEPEQAVRVVLEGIVKAVDKSSPEMTGYGLPGRLQLEVRSLRVMRQDNSFEELALDDE